MQQTIYIRDELALEAHPHSDAERLSFRRSLVSAVK